jgi:hypothetical protein
MHKWSDFEELKKGYARAWDRIKEDTGEDDRAFLGRSYLVVTCGNTCRQMDFFISDPMKIAMDNPDFFIRDKHSRAYLEMGQKARDYRDKGIDPPEGFFDKFKKYDLSEVTIVPFDVEVRFPGVRIDAIQNLKKSAYCDHKKTNMSRASIAVFLKWID